MRDVAYWNKFSHRLNDEVWDMAPIREELVSLGVPPGPITIPHPMPGVRMIGGRVGRHGLNVSGLIKWAQSPMASQLLFSGIHTNRKGVEAASRHLMSVAF